MDNSAIYPEFSPLAAINLVESLFGINIKQDRYDEWSLIALNKIGRNYIIGEVYIEVDENGYVKLPCDFKLLESVSISNSRFTREKSTERESGITQTSHFGDNYQDISVSKLEVKGSFVDFRWVRKDLLKVDPGLKGYTAIVKGHILVVDDEGNPLLNENQLEALAYYLAFLQTQRDAFRKVESIDLAYIKSESTRKIAAANVPVYVTQNEWDAMLNAKVSYNRKMFGRDFKLVSG